MYSDGESLPKMVTWQRQRPDWTAKRGLAWWVAGNLLVGMQWRCKRWGTQQGQGSLVHELRRLRKQCPVSSML